MREPFTEGSLSRQGAGHGVLTEASLPRAQARVPAELGNKGTGSREQGATTRVETPAVGCPWRLRLIRQVVIGALSDGSTLK